MWWIKSFKNAQIHMTKAVQVLPINPNWSQWLSSRDRPDQNEMHDIFDIPLTVLTAPHLNQPIICQISALVYIKMFSHFRIETLNLDRSWNWIPNGMFLIFSSITWIKPQNRRLSVNLLVYTAQKFINRGHWSANVPCTWAASSVPIAIFAK